MALSPSNQSQLLSVTRPNILDPDIHPHRRFSTSRHAMALQGCLEQSRNYSALARRKLRAYHSRRDGHNEVLTDRLKLRVFCVWRRFRTHRSHSY